MINIIKFLFAVAMTVSAFHEKYQCRSNAFTSLQGRAFVKATSNDAVTDELQRANEISRSLLLATANSLNAFISTEKQKTDDQIGKAGAVVLGALCSLYFIHDLYAAAAAACLTSVIASRNDNIGDATRKAGNIAVDLVKLAAEFEKESNNVKSIGAQLSEQFSSLVSLAVQSENPPLPHEFITTLDTKNISAELSTITGPILAITETNIEAPSHVNLIDPIAVLEDHYANKWTQTHTDLFYGWGPIHTPEEGASSLPDEIFVATEEVAVAMASELTSITTFETSSSVSTASAASIPSQQSTSGPEPEKEPRDDEEQEEPVDELEAWRQWGRDIDWGLVKLSGSLIYEELQKGIIQARTKLTPVDEGEETDNMTELFNDANSQISFSKRQGGKVKNGKIVLPDEILEHVAAHGGTIGKMKRLSTVPLASLQRVLTERRGGSDDTVTTGGKKTKGVSDVSKPIDELELRQQERIQSHLAKKQTIEALQRESNPATTKKKSPSAPSSSVVPTIPKSTTAKSFSSTSTINDAIAVKPKHSGLTSAEYEARNAWRKLVSASRDSSGPTPSKSSNNNSGRPQSEPPYDSVPETFEQMKLRVTRQWVVEICERARQIEESRLMKKSFSN